MKATFWLILTVSMMVSACTTTSNTVVDTPEQWIYHFKQGSLMRGTSESVINRPAARTLADITEYSDKCINGKIIKISGWLGNQFSSSVIRYTSGVKNTPGGRSVFYMQTVNPGYQYPGMPENGYYAFAAEISGDTKQTKITHYYLDKFSKYVTPLEDWANGKKGTCPELSQ